MGSLLEPGPQSHGTWRDRDVLRQRATRVRQTERSDQLAVCRPAPDIRPCTRRRTAAATTTRRIQPHHHQALLVAPRTRNRHGEPRLGGSRPHHQLRLHLRARFTSEPAFRESDVAPWSFATVTAIQGHLYEDSKDKHAERLESHRSPGTVHKTQTSHCSNYRQATDGISENRDVPDELSPTRRRHIPPLLLEVQLLQFVGSKPQIETAGVEAAVRSTVSRRSLRRSRALQMGPMLCDTESPPSSCTRPRKTIRHGVRQHPTHHRAVPESEVG